MSDENPNLADFLNDNAGVVGAGAGYAVNRSVQNTNRNIDNLRKEIGSIQQEMAKRRRQEQQDQRKREEVFQVSVEADHILGSEPSPATLLQARKLKDTFDGLRLSSASFPALQDKEFYNATAVKVRELGESIHQALPTAVLDRISSLIEWHEFGKASQTLIETERSIHTTEQDLEDGKARLEFLNESRLTIRKALRGGGGLYLNALGYAASFFAALSFASFIIAGDDRDKPDTSNTPVHVTAATIQSGWKAPSRTEQQQSPAEQQQKRWTAMGVIAIVLGTIFIVATAINYTASKEQQEAEAKKASNFVEQLKGRLQGLYESRSEARRVVLRSTCAPQNLKDHIVDSVVPIENRSATLVDVHDYTAGLRAELKIDEGLLPI